MSAPTPLEAALGSRPVPGTPRPFTFPAVERGRLSGGLPVQAVHLPGRPLVTANLLLPMGAVDEPAAVGGATVLAARALTEGTRRHDAVALVEAAERLGASLRAEAGWDATTVGVEVPVERLAEALALLAEVAREPSFPPREVERLRDQRLNDLLQARADPSRRADEVYLATIYDPRAPYARAPRAACATTVLGLDADVAAAATAAGPASVARPSWSAATWPGSTSRRSWSPCWATSRPRRARPRRPAPATPGGWSGRSCGSCIARDPCSRSFGSGIRASAAGRPTTTPWRSCRRSWAASSTAAST